MALESISEKPETRIEKIIKHFSKLRDAMITADPEEPEISLLLSQLQKKTPEERKAYKVDVQEDFLELNKYFSSIKHENKNEKSKIVAIMAPIFDALDRGDVNPVMESFFYKLLPPRSFIQDYYN